MSAAAVGGAGTASLNVPRLASDADADAAAPVVVLQLLFTPSVVDVVGGVVSSRTAATEVERQIAVTHVHAQGLSDADSTARLAGLRAGTIAGATKREVAYAALFERTRAAQQRIVAAIAADATPMAPLPTADEARAGPTLPVANVAAALRVDAAAVASGCRATVEALGAAAGTGRLLAAAYDGLDWGTDAIVARLRLLALRGVDGLTTPPTATEREYAAHFAPARTLRRLVSETLASVTAAAPAPAASTAEAAVAGSCYKPRHRIVLACNAAPLTSSPFACHIVMAPPLALQSTAKRPWFTSISAAATALCSRECGAPTSRTLGQRQMSCCR